jgi:hypothetical protein
MDLVGYDKYLNGQLSDCPMSDAEVKEFQSSFSKFPKPDAIKTGKW